MPLTTLFNRTRMLVLVYTLLIITSSYPQPVIIPPTTANKFTKKLIVKKVSVPTALAEWVSVSGLFSLPIIQQPKDNPIFVTNKPEILTQFQRATQNGVTGLLAHNFLSGREFSKMKIGQEISIRYTDHLVRNYQVASIYRFQKLDPSDVFSDLIDLHSGKERSSSDVFDQFYRGRHHVTFQTCLEEDGRLDWGLLFVVALPIKQ